MDDVKGEHRLGEHRTPWMIAVPETVGDPDERDDRRPSLHLPRDMEQDDRPAGRTHIARPVPFDPRDRQKSEHRQHRRALPAARDRSEEHTSELQSLMRISYAVFCLEKKTSTLNTLPT